jgi:predicted cupin superfamily sugar epimerase
MHPRAVSLLQQLDLRPHPEGGWFREVFRSQWTVRPDDRRAQRSAVTTIYYLLADGGFSRWHRVASDEVWHFYEGDPLELFWLEDDGTRWMQTTLGPVGDASLPAHVIPAQRWQACRTTGAYTLVGCTVAPGFDFADFEMLADCPRDAEVIRRHFPNAEAML